MENIEFNNKVDIALVASMDSDAEDKFDLPLPPILNPEISEYDIFGDM